MLLRPDSPSLSIVAITGGGPALEPEVVPTAFFNLFARTQVKERVGLFAENLVPAKQLPNIKDRAGVKEAYDRRDEIHLIVTSMGDLRDPHDILRSYLQGAGISDSDIEKYAGNVQYRPYLADGKPVIEEPDELRAVTLFELEDLERIAATKDRHVLLICRSCSKCEGRTRASALRPLLAKGQKCFSELVLGVDTARELIAGSTKKGSK